MASPVTATKYSSFSSSTAKVSVIVFTKGYFLSSATIFHEQVNSGTVILRRDNMRASKLSFFSNSISTENVQFPIDKNFARLHNECAFSVGHDE